MRTSSGAKTMGSTERSDRRRIRYPRSGASRGSATSNPLTHRWSNLDRTSTCVPGYARWDWSVQLIDTSARVGIRIAHRGDDARARQGSRLSKVGDQEKGHQRDGEETRPREPTETVDHLWRIRRALICPSPHSRCHDRSPRWLPQPRPQGALPVSPPNGHARWAVGENR